MSPEPRRALPVPLRVRVQPSVGEAREAWALDLSPGGLCLRVRAPLAEGDDVALHLALPPGAPPTWSRGRVVWVSRDAASDGAPRSWEVGVRFEALEPALRTRLAEWAGAAPDRGR
jgi:uncharacterized protein (TIGR02266 family)